MPNEQENKDKQISMCRLTAGAVRHSGRNMMQKR